MVVEGIHVEDIFELVYLVLSLSISWTFRMLAHEEDQYTVMFRKYWADLLSIALKQTKAGPRSSGTPFQVITKMHVVIIDSHFNISPIAVVDM